MQSLAGLLLDLAGNLLPAREPALSELGRSLTSRGRAISGDAHHGRRVLVQDLADLLVTADPGTPVLIILEDLHWADELSLDVLGHLAGRLAGFAIKAGLVPFQIWLPRGYSAAPGPVRAIMAGVCVNVAFYGMWRTLALLGRTPGWLVGVVLVLGGLSALLGIAHAAVQNRLSRVIAYSSIENSGLIVTGFGVALTGAAVGDRRLVTVGLLAATLQLVAHTIAKSLLFTSVAGIEAAGGSDDLEDLRQPARRTPWSCFGLAIGSVTLAGLPPTIGFVSEWFCSSR